MGTLAAAQWIGPSVAVAALMAAAGGAAKLRRPDPAARALASIGFRAGRGAVRALASVELVVGLACLVDPRPASTAILAGLYAAFALFLVVLMRRGDPAASCGCLGEREAPPTLLHVLLDAAAATAAALAAAAPPDGALASAWHLGAAGVPYLAGIAGTAAAAYLAVAYVPALFLSYGGHAPATAGTRVPEARP